MKHTILLSQNFSIVIMQVGSNDRVNELQYEIIKEGQDYKQLLEEFCLILYWYCIDSKGLDSLLVLSCHGVLRWKHWGGSKLKLKQGNLKIFWSVRRILQANMFNRKWHAILFWHYTNIILHHVTPMSFSFRLCQNRLLSVDKLMTGLPHTYAWCKQNGMQFLNFNSTIM